MHTDEAVLAAASNKDDEVVHEYSKKNIQEE
jgi:hypothetical protein